MGRDKGPKVGGKAEKGEAASTTEVANTNSASRATHCGLCRREVAIGEEEHIAGAARCLRPPLSAPPPAAVVACHCRLLRCHPHHSVACLRSPMSASLLLPPVLPAAAACQCCLPPLVLSPPPAASAACRRHPHHPVASLPSQCPSRCPCCCSCLLPLPASPPHTPCRCLPAGECSKCGQLPFHTDCVKEHLEKTLKPLVRNGGYGTRAWEKILQKIKQRPVDMLARNGTSQRLTVTCPACSGAPGRSFF